MIISQDFNPINELKTTPGKWLVFGLGVATSDLARAAFGDSLGRGEDFWASKEQIIPFLSKFNNHLSEINLRGEKVIGQDFELTAPMRDDAAKAVKTLLLQGRLAEEELAFHAPLLAKLVNDLPTDIATRPGIKHFVEKFNGLFEIAKTPQPE